MRRPKTTARGSNNKLSAGKLPPLVASGMGATGAPTRGFQTQTTPLEASLAQVPLCSPSFRRIKHRINVRKIHMIVMWLCAGEEKTV